MSECLKDRDDPTVRIKIDDDDCLTVRGSSVLLRETFQFWTSEEWICSVQGPALTNLLYEVREPKKTLQMLDEAFEKIWYGVKTMTKEFSTVGVFGKRDSLDYEPLRIIAELLIKSGRQVLLEKKAGRSPFARRRLYPRRNR